LNVVSAAAPIFTIPIENAFVDDGQTAVFRCYATGVPEVSYKWFVNATRLNSSMLAPADRPRYTFSSRGNILTITSVHQPDAGMYQCQASNTHGIKLCSAELRILSKLCRLQTGCMQDPHNIKVTLNFKKFLKLRQSHSAATCEVREIEPEKSKMHLSQ